MAATSSATCGCWRLATITSAAKGRYEHPAASRKPLYYISLSSRRYVSPFKRLRATSSDLSDSERRISEDYVGAFQYAGGSFEGDSSSSPPQGSLSENLEAASQLSESVPSSSVDQLEEGGGGSDDNTGSGGGGHRRDDGFTGGDGQGEDSESANNKKKKLLTSQKITLAYAFLIGVGGAIGYLKSRSVKSLVTGITSSLALLIVYLQLPANPVLASSMGLGISATLLFVMGKRFQSSKKVFPAGVVSVASFIMVAGYIHGIMRSFHA